VKIFVLAAGYGTRLYPLTRDRAKPLLEIGGRPVLSRILDRLLELPELSRVIVIGNQRFAEQLKGWASGFACPVPLQVLNDGSTDDQNKLGALGDLAFALDEVPLEGEDWLVVAGDNLIEFDLVQVEAAFRISRGPRVVVRRVERDGSPTAYNEVVLAAGRSGERVARFREKPANPESEWAAIALYLFTPEVEGHLRRYLSEGGNRDAPGHFLAWLTERVPVFASRLRGEWFDIGSLAALERARAHFAPDE
jgi:glucose-1-phosphate thymidylyltransferase